MSESLFEAHIRVMSIMQNRDLKSGSPINLIRKQGSPDGFTGSGVIEDIRSDRYLTVKAGTGESVQIPWVDIDDL
jgi:hypothetical protein